jgi:hypothetical protein
MVEEVFKICKPTCRRKHMVLVEGEVREVSPEAVKKSRYMSKIEKLIELERK